MTSQYWIRRLRLKPHPEGGHYRETYRAADKISASALPRRFGGGPRTASTAIYFLLRLGDFSAFHRIRSDEIWHFYAGGPVRITMIDGRGRLRTRRLGPGGAPQCVVPAGTWFGAAPDRGADYSLVGCTVAPGFDFKDFELGDRKDLLKIFSRHSAAIRRLTR